MKNPNRSLWALYLAVALTVFLGCWQHFAYAAEHAKIDKDSDVELLFDWEGKDVNGQDVVVVVAEFVLRADPPASPPLPPVRILTTMAPVVGTNTHIARQLFVDTVVGEYLMTVRVKSDAGAFSSESNILPIEITAKKPAAPLRLRVGGR
jgi:hypothetical protein